MKIFNYNNRKLRWGSEFEELDEVVDSDIFSSTKEI
jgi:hypothetical protein